jgi:hypothetical protein
MAQDGHKGTLLNFQTYPIQHHRAHTLGGRVGKAEVLGLNDGGHGGPSDVSKK